MEWMNTYYINPMRRLAARFNTSSQRPALSYTPTYTAPVVTQRRTTTTSKRKGWICGVVTVVIIIIIIISSTTTRKS